MADVTTRGKLAFWGLIITAFLFSAVPSLVVLEKARDYRTFLTGANPSPLKMTVTRSTPDRKRLDEESLPDVHFVDFRLDAPEAKAVTLGGDFNKWDPASLNLKRSEAGAWEVSLPLPAGSYRYAFIVDGKWQLDPAAAEKTRRDGREVSVKAVP